MVHILSSCNQLEKIWCILFQYVIRLRKYGAYFGNLSLVWKNMVHIEAFPVFQAFCLSK